MHKKIRFAGAMALIAFCLFTDVSLGQCCLGAQHRSALSLGGEYRVEAKSLTGTGPNAHGPYHFKFQFSKRNAKGQYDELHTFELKWNVTSHFNMKIMVSPTGNGFAVLFPYEQMTFYRCDGKKVIHLHEKRSYSMDKDGHNIRILEYVYLQYGGDTVEDGRFFLPLGTKATKDVSYQVSRFLQYDPKRQKDAEEEVMKVVRKLASSNESARVQAKKEILRYGFLAIPALTELANSHGDLWIQTTVKELKEKLSGWSDVNLKSGWRNLELLKALLHYPDENLRERAMYRLWEFLPESVPKKRTELLVWLAENQPKLTWNEKKFKYVLPAK